MKLDSASKFVFDFLLQVLIKRDKKGLY